MNSSLSAPFSSFSLSGYQPHSSQSQTLLLPPSLEVDIKAVSAVACDLFIACAELTFIMKVAANLEAKRITVPIDAAAAAAAAAVGWAGHGSTATERPVSIHDVWRVSYAL